MCILLNTSVVSLHSSVYVFSLINTRQAYGQFFQKVRCYLLSEDCYEESRSTYVINRCLGKGIYELKNMKGEVLKKKANIARLTVFKDRTELPDSDPPSTANKASDTSRKWHPSTTIDDPKSGKRQLKHQVIISNDDDDPEGKSQSNGYLCLSMIILYNSYR